MKIHLIFLKNIFDLTPIFFGTIITCSSSIVKFKKYQEKMEELYIVIDKCIIMMGKLKIIREKIKLLDDCGEEFFLKIKNEYINDLCKGIFWFTKKQKDISVTKIMIFI